MRLLEKPAPLRRNFTFSLNAHVFTISGGKTTRENSENDENRFECLSSYHKPAHYHNPPWRKNNVISGTIGSNAFRLSHPGFRQVGISETQVKKMRANRAN